MALPGLIAKKIGMTRMIDAEGQMIPVTLLQVGEQQITKVLSSERDGYDAVQVGYYPKPEHRLTKPDITRLRKAGVDKNFARFREIRAAQPVGEELAVGVGVSLGMFDGVVQVDVTGVTKGRGFQGAIKRWNSATGRRTHGSRFHRRPGSLGANTSPGRVFKNKKMPGHMGDAQRTIQNLRVVDIDQENNVIALKGSVPGHRDGFLIIRPSVKAR